MVAEDITLTLTDGVTSGSIRVIRYDTPVNNGNSGGGLFDAYGNLIGIVNAKLLSTDDFNYAIPSNVAISIANSIIRNCNGTDTLTTDVILLGISTQGYNSYAVLDENTGRTYVKHDIKVALINEDSVCKDILQLEDILISFTYNGKTIPIDNARTMHDYRFDFLQGTSIVFTIKRGETVQNVSIVMSVVIPVA